MDFVVPLSVERIAFDVKFLHLGVGNFASFVVLVFVEPAVNLQACAGSRRSDQVDDDFQGFQGNTLPSAGDMAEDTMFDLVPFAGSRREMTNLDDHPRLVGESLKFELPQAVAGTVAAATIGRNEQSPRVPVSLRSQS